ncbi:glycosyl hydrolase-related protein [Paenibacillus piri]|uniref:Glycoside hydrolase family 38 N-terminal domain-containing protein n=1 Tax=Paenibacillus piri TaxID=2547395 RepID=A0A4R5KZN2_9BACL|nr:glycosyl hydrolase-related protein [Paenibacillus piri]TDG00706.1 hypothetical protein E1757_03525 [Paenibacillus piri]
MASQQQNVYVAHSSHLDLYWIGTQNECLDIGADIIDDAVNLSRDNREFTFLIDTVRFLEYYLAKYPGKKQQVRQLFESGQFEVAACYTDRLENHHDGESLIRNVTYGKRTLKRLLGLDTDIAYHPDLPGLAEQSPQIYKKTGVRYYLFARGFLHGGRFWWKGLDDSRIIAYNFPVHYSYYNIDKEIVPKLRDIRQSIQSSDVLLSCSAGDLGPANTFFSRDEYGKWQRVTLTDTIRELNLRYPELHFELSGTKRILDRMDTAGLEERSGEYPSKWGATGSTTNVQLFHLDKRISAVLLEAEKLSSICGLLGIAVEYGPRETHPLKHRGGSGGSRKYFELQQHPQNMAEWFDFAWRLQLITQDHNYAGVNGIQSNFDRFRYKECALQIAENIRELSIQAIAAHIGTPADAGTVIVFNSLNWSRSEPVTILPLGLDEAKTYIVEDAEGGAYPLIPTKEGYSFYAANMPSVGYKAFTVKEGSQPVPSAKRLETTAERITVRNSYYELIVDRRSGTLVYVKDLETDTVVIDDPAFLSLDIYQDLSDCVSEKISNKVKRESSMDHVRSVTVAEDHCLWTQIEIVTEIANSKARIDIVVNHQSKEIRLNPTVYWIGETHLQLNLNMSFPARFADIVYGVPYGVQKKGCYLYDESPWAPDEISPELYDRYREAMGWFAVESGDGGICVCGNHSAYDFTPDVKQAILIRNVPSCGDKDVLMPNNGKLEWEFRLSSYSGGWEANQAHLASWEQQYPLQPRKKNAHEHSAPQLPPTGSFISTKGCGILSVLKKSDTDPQAYVLRMFNSTSRESVCGIETTLPVRSLEACDMNELPVDEDQERLAAFEIKTLIGRIERDVPDEP